MGNTDPPDPTPFLEEVRRRYDSIHDVRKSIESKANSMISVSGTLTGLFFGFGYFIVQNLGPEFVHIQIVTALLVIGIFCTIIALLLSLYAYKVKKYLFVFPGGTFFNEKKEKTYKVNEAGKKEYILDGLRSLPTNEFKNEMINSYVDANETNDPINDGRAELIWFSQWMLFAGILLVPIASFIGFSSVLYPSYTNIPPEADAGTHQNISENSLVKLDSARSDDQDGRLKQFIWHQLCGMPVILNNDTSPTPVFRAPVITNNSISNETLGFGLVITDEKNAASTDNVTITVENEDYVEDQSSGFSNASITSSFFESLNTVASNNNSNSSINSSKPSCTYDSKFKLTGYQWTAYNLPDSLYDYSIHSVSGMHIPISDKIGPKH